MKFNKGNIEACESLGFSIEFFLGCMGKRKKAEDFDDPLKDSNDKTPISSGLNIARSERGKFSGHEIMGVD
jgi:hypothetical protein